MEERKEALEVTGRGFAVLGYFGIFCLIPLLARRRNPFVMLHAKQGAIIFILSLIVRWIPVVGEFILMPLLVILCIIGIVQAIRRKYWKIPLIGNLAEKIKI